LGWLLISSRYLVSGGSPEVRPQPGGLALLLLARLAGHWIAEPDAWPAAVLIDELDPGSLECAPYDVERGSTGRIRVSLEQAHGDDADRGFVREILLTPIEKAPGGPALFRCDHPARMHEVIYLFNSVEKQLTGN
jgi:hypothetical protein